MNGITRRFYLVNQADVDKFEKLENSSQIPDLLVMQIPKINLVNIISSYFPLERDWTMEYARDNLAYTSSHLQNSFNINNIYWNNETVQINADFVSTEDNKTFLRTLRLDITKEVQDDSLHKLFDIIAIYNFVCFSVSFDGDYANTFYVYDQDFMNFKQFLTFK